MGRSNRVKSHKVKKTCFRSGEKACVLASTVEPPNYEMPKDCSLYRGSFNNY